MHFFFFFFYSLICVLCFCFVVFLYFLVLFGTFWCLVFFLCFLFVSNLIVKKNKKFKTDLMTSFILLLISPPSRSEVNETIEILNRLTLFTREIDLDPLLLKVSNKINQRKLDRMKQSSISDFFKKQ